MTHLETGSGSNEQLAVVVGAGGMGMAVARRMAYRYRILLADIDEDRAVAGAARLREEGGRAAGLRCDVTDQAAVQKLADRVDELGNFRALLHVAGLSPSMADFDTIMRVNLVGVVNVAHALLPMASRGTAAVLISSLAAHNFMPTEQSIAVLRDNRDSRLVERLREVIGEGGATPEAAYQLSKWAVIDFCRLSARAWGERAARIVSLSPGLIATPQGALELDVRPSKRRMLERSPLQREGTMLEITDAIEFLVSDRAAFISGTDLLVDGGLAAVLGSGQH